MTHIVSVHYDLKQKETVLFLIIIHRLLHRLGHYYANIHVATQSLMRKKIYGLQGASYLELAEFIMQNGAQSIQDLEQLWRRIVFYICISNTDDHLRHHGFLLQPGKAWILLPAYNINPNPMGHGLTLNISDADNAQDLELAKEVAQFFRISAHQCEAKKLDISSNKQDLMERAFRVVEKM
jgi:serine/threonine protein kinase HipA of HipAB toxin-antitoxin module